jgi:hypothetical protein
MINTTEANNTRRYDIDHLRVMAFGLLIFYHIGMLYVADWGYYIKSSYLSEELAILMLLVNPWRMPLIWMISGIASYFLIKKLSFGEFLTSRTLRLLIPLTFGIFLVVPPQLYFEMKANGDMPLTMWQFWQVFFDLDNPLFEKYQSGILPHVDVNHLWYLRALWPFSLLLLALSPLLNSKLVTKSMESSTHLFGRFSILLWPVILLVILDLFVLNGVDSDRERQVLGFCFFIIGYLIANQPGVWQAVKNLRGHSLVLAIISFGLVIITYQMIYLNDAVVKTDIIELLLSFLYQANRWLWLTCIFGFAFTYLNKKSKVIEYLNPAVFPFYILHQTVIIWVGYPLIQMHLGGFVEAGLILLATFVICALSYEFISKTHFLKPFFGVNIGTTQLPILPNWLFKPMVYRSVGLLLVLPIGLPIFIWVFRLS